MTTKAMLEISEDDVGKYNRIADKAYASGRCSPEDLTDMSLFAERMRAALDAAKAEAQRDVQRLRNLLAEHGEKEARDAHRECCAGFGPASQCDCSDPR